jgi:hypothetical protein
MIGLASVSEERTAAVLSRENTQMVINVVTAVKILKYLVMFSLSPASDLPTQTIKITRTLILGEQRGMAIPREEHALVPADSIQRRIIS